MFCYTWREWCLSILIAKFLFIMCNVEVVVIIIIEIDFKIIIYIAATNCFFKRNK